MTSSIVGAWGSTTRSPVPELHDFAAVLAEGELRDDEPRAVEVRGGEVVLIQSDGRVRALAARCTHMGARLAGGRVEAGVLVCPWHGSCFDVRNGSVAHGPAVFPLPSYETRVMDGQIEVRRISNG